MPSGYIDAPRLSFSLIKVDGGWLIEQMGDLTSHTSGHFAPAPPTSRYRIVPEGQKVSDQVIAMIVAARIG